MGKVKDIAASRQRDLAACADAYLNIRACPGGRPIVDGLVCPHCGMDTSDGDCNGVVGVGLGAG